MCGRDGLLSYGTRVAFDFSCIEYGGWVALAGAYSAGPGCEDGP